VEVPALNHDQVVVEEEHLEALVLAELNPSVHLEEVEVVGQNQLEQNLVVVVVAEVELTLVVHLEEVVEVVELYLFVHLEGVVEVEELNLFVQDLEEVGEVVGLILFG
jgi:hypothetical protein